ncbi:MAG: recombinase family protein [Candidatus Omnitrophica bacterium]|nr:recombinase family protein [Candidatus Omnitrophota bacterium]
MHQKITKCFVYARVSTDEQASGQYSSIDSQVDICKHYIEIQKEKGWHFVASYTDPGFSGKNLERPGIQQVISDIKQGKIDVLIVYKIERLVRSIKDFYMLWDLFEAHNVTFVSATQQFDSSNAMGKLMLNVLLSFAQFERENTSEKTRDKMKQRARLGKWHGGLYPFGYDYSKETKKLSINKTESIAVKKSFSMLLEGRKPTEIANYLNSKGFRTKTRKITTKEGIIKTTGENRFNDDFIKKIILNPIYKGFVHFNDEQFKGEHEELVSTKVWEKANQLMKPVTPRKTEYAKDTHTHLLKGLLKCGQCGTFLTPYPAGKKDKNGVPYLYYACGKVVDFGKHSDCKVRMIPAREFENIIKKCLTDLGNNKSLIEYTIKNSTEFTKNKILPFQNQKEKAEQQLAKIISEINRIIKIMKSQDLIGNEITDEYKKLLYEKSSLQNQIEKLTIDIERCKQDVLDAEMIKKTILAFDKVINALPIEDQKDIFNLLIRDITVWGFEPEKEKAPKELGAFTAKIRTKWLKIKLSLFQFPQIETYYKSLSEKKGSSDNSPKWLPREGSNLGPIGYT